MQSLHESETVVALLSSVYLAPGVLLALFAGGIVDRNRKRRILIAADIFRALVVASVTATVRAACEDARNELFARIAPALNVEPSALVAKDGRIHVKDNPAQGMPWRDACKRLGIQPISALLSRQRQCWPVTSRPSHRRSAGRSN